MVPKIPVDYSQIHARTHAHIYSLCQERIGTVTLIALRHNGTIISVMPCLQVDHLTVPVEPPPVPRRNPNVCINHRTDSATGDVHHGKRGGGGGVI